MASNVEACRTCLPPKTQVDDVDDRKKTLLMRAAQRGHVGCTKALIKAGADVNAVDIEGNTALKRCCEKGRIECAKLLIQNGADVNITDNVGHTAIVSACADGHLECVKALIEAKAKFRQDPNDKGPWGWNLVQDTAERNQWENPESIT